MNYRMIAHLLGIILLIETALLAAPAAVALIYGEDIIPFAVTVAILLVVSLPAVCLKPANTTIYTRDGFVCVAAAWILMSAFGALPFIISGSIPNFIDAFFETVSGFTTTGASILTAVEHLPKGILFWRSFTHWIGGMGVLVFVLAILPSGDGRAIHLLRAEVPGPTKGKLVPKLRQTARILYGIYIGLTVAEILILIIVGMPVYDSVVTSFATAGTGGFAVKNLSIAAYGNPAAEWTIAVFMMLCGINFNMYYFLLIKRFRDVVKSEELRAYLFVCLISSTIIAINTFRMFENAGDCIRTAFFQVTTIISTTGFATTDFNLWPELSKTVLVILMLLGACAGSTAGGLKISRVLIVLKSTAREIKQMLKPRSVNVIRLDGEVVPEETVRSAVNYISLYIVIFIASTLLISADGFGLTTNLTATLACLNNIGPGLAEVGPTGNFSGFSMFSKLILSLDMLIGRLEIMPMIILFSPSAWKKH